MNSAQDEKRKPICRADKNAKKRGIEVRDLQKAKRAKISIESAQEEIKRLNTLFAQIAKYKEHHATYIGNLQRQLQLQLASGFFDPPATSTRIFSPSKGDIYSKFISPIKCEEIEPKDLKSTCKLVFPDVKKNGFIISE